MFAAMPIFFIPFVIGVPAGVMIYWITTNVWTICQQGVIKRTMGHRLRPARPAPRRAVEAAVESDGAQGHRQPDAAVADRTRARRAAAAAAGRKKRRGGGRRR